jgi:triosephosphate isomerase
VGSPDLVIQYGGSVKPSNIDELMGMSDIDAKDGGRDRA